MFYLASGGLIFTRISLTLTQKASPHVVGMPNATPGA